MKTNALILILVSSASGATSAWAQIAREQVMAMPMPPAHYDVVKNLGYRGDYGYYLLGESRPLEGDSPDQWNFVLYRNTAGKDIWIYPAYEGPGCAHGHLTYGVWGKYEYTMWPGITFLSRTYRGYVWLGGGTVSGDSINGQCVRTTQPSWAKSLGAAGAIFGWGELYKNVNLRQYPIKTATYSYTINEIVVGAYASSHGEGDCGVFACRQPNWINLWSL